MTDCDRIDSLVTPYVDGDISPADAVAVRRHLQRCPACCGRVHAEQAIHALLRTHRGTLSSVEPSSELRRRCAVLHVSPASFAWRWRALAIAAGFVLLAAI